MSGGVIHSAPPDNLKMESNDKTLMLKSLLQPGDTILYFSHDVFDWIIALKTWCKAAHVEMYRGDGMSYASRNGIGVNTYPTRFSDVAAIVRPVKPLDMQSIALWFETVRGEGYDWAGLLCFTLAVRHGSNRKQFCSELMTRLWRKGKGDPFNRNWDADRVPPSFFLVTGAGKLIWQDGDLF